MFPLSDTVMTFRDKPVAAAWIDIGTMDACTAGRAATTGWNDWS